MTTQEAVRTMSDFVNNMSMNPKEFVEGMGNEHRTLQQTFTNLCFEWIKYNAAQFDKKIYDGRNEFSCKVCKEITEKVEWVNYSCPFIQEIKMTTEQMQEVFMYDKDLLTPDEAVELLADMFDEGDEITPNKIRQAFNLKEKVDEQYRFLRKYLDEQTSFCYN